MATKESGMIGIIGPLVGAVLGTGTALATFVTTALTVASTLYSMHNMFEGISEGDVGKALVSGIGAFTGIKGLSDMAGAASTATDVTSTASEVQTGVFDMPEVTGSSLVDNTMTPGVLAESAALDYTSPIAEATEGIVPVEDLVKQGRFQDVPAERVLAEPTVTPEVKPTPAPVVEKSPDGLSKLIGGVFSGDGDLSDLGNILNSKGMGYGLQGLAALRADRTRREMLKRQEEQYNRSARRLGDYSDTRLFA